MGPNVVWGAFDRSRSARKEITYVHILRLHTIPHHASCSNTMNLMLYCCHKETVPCLDYIKSSGSFSNGSGVQNANTVPTSTRTKISNTGVGGVSSSSSGVTTTVMIMGGGVDNSDTTTSAGDIVNSNNKLVKIHGTVGRVPADGTSSIITYNVSRRPERMLDNGVVIVK